MLACTGMALALDVPRVKVLGEELVELMDSHILFLLVVDLGAQRA